MCGDNLVEGVPTVFNIVYHEAFLLSNAEAFNFHLESSALSGEHGSKDDVDSAEGVVHGMYLLWYSGFFFKEIIINNLTFSALKWIKSRANLN